MENLNTWKQAGNVYLWRYRGNYKNYTGFHITADERGAGSLVELIDLMLGSPGGARRTVQLSPATRNELRVPNAPYKVVSFDKLVLTINSEQRDAWSLDVDDGKVTLEAGGEGVLGLKNGLLDMAQGEGDYCIGSGEHELWFWWHLEG